MRGMVSDEVCIKHTWIWAYSILWLQCSGGKSRVLFTPIGDMSSIQLVDLSKCRKNTDTCLTDTIKKPKTYGYQVHGPLLNSKRYISYHTISIGLGVWDVARNVCIRHGNACKSSIPIFYTVLNNKEMQKGRPTVWQIWTPSYRWQWSYGSVGESHQSGHGQARQTLQLLRLQGGQVPGPDWGTDGTKCRGTVQAVEYCFLLVRHVSYDLFFPRERHRKLYRALSDVPGSMSI